MNKGSFEEALERLCYRNNSYLKMRYLLHFFIINANITTALNFKNV